MVVERGLFHHQMNAVAKTSYKICALWLPQVQMAPKGDPTRLNTMGKPFFDCLV